MDTTLPALLARTTATGYVVLTTMDLVMLEAAMARATVPDPAPAYLPTTVEDYRFMKRQHALERANN